MRLGVVVSFPGDFDDGHVGVGVGVVGAQGGDVLEGMDGGFVLLSVEEGDAVVVPAHPCWLRGRRCLEVAGVGGVVANVQGLGVGGDSRTGCG